MGNTANYDSTLRKKQLSKCAKSPTCLDELYEWTVWATDMIHNLENVDFGTIRAFVRRSSIMGHCKDLDLIHQQNIDFSREKAVDLSDFFEANVMLLVEIGFSAESEKELNCSISVSEICNYYVLLRRYFEFMEIRNTIPKKCNSPSKCSECIICMSRHEDVVLPCLHSMCSHCASKWIDVSGDCPFCRKRYNSRKKFETNQWKIENLPHSTLDDDLRSLESKLKSFWFGRVSTELARSTDVWLPLGISPSGSLVIPLD